MLRLNDGEKGMGPPPAGLRQAGYTLAVIDTQGVGKAATAAAMRSADLSLIPARPSALDIEAARPTMGSLARLDRSYAFIINQSPPGRSARTQDAFKALALLGVLAQPFHCAASRPLSTQSLWPRGCEI